MQNIPPGRKWSDIKGLAAVTTESGEKVGTIDDFYFDPQNNTIYAWRIKTGLFGHQVLLSSAVKGIGHDAVTFSTKTDLLKEDADARLQSLPQGEILLNYRVLSESGTVAGTVGNIVLDPTVPTVPRIAGFEMAGGLRERISGHHHGFSSAQVKRYGPDVIVVPDEILSSLIDK